jgi:hypothetical protein
VTQTSCRELYNAEAHDLLFSELFWLVEFVGRSYKLLGKNYVGVYSTNIDDRPIL